MRMGGRNSTYHCRAAPARPWPGGSECLDQAVTGRGWSALVRPAAFETSFKRAHFASLGDAPCSFGLG